MVLQVLADPGEGMDNRNLQLLQQVSWTNSGQLQELRRADGAGRENGFAFCFCIEGIPVFRELDATRLFPGEPYF